MEDDDVFIAPLAPLTEQAVEDLAESATKKVKLLAALGEETCSALLAECSPHFLMELSAVSLLSRADAERGSCEAGRGNQAVQADAGVNLSPVLLGWQ
jgi:hypothetical protein